MLSRPIGKPHQLPRRILAQRQLFKPLRGSAKRGLRGCIANKSRDFANAHGTQCVDLRLEQWH